MSTCKGGLKKSDAQNGTNPGLEAAPLRAKAFYVDTRSILISMRLIKGNFHPHQGLTPNA